MVAHASDARSNPKVQLDLHREKYIVGDNCLVIHDQNRPVNVYSYDTKDHHRSAQTVDPAVDYQYSQSGQRFILIINLAICSNGLVNHLLCHMQCHLNGVQISEVPKFVAENLSEITHAIE